MCVDKEANSECPKQHLISEAGCVRMLVVWQLEVLNSCQVARLGNSSVSAPGRKQEAEQQSLCSQDQLGNPAQA